MPDHPQLAGMAIGAARDLLAEARAVCDRDDRVSEANIHRVRVNLKRVRAYWRLMRFALGREAEQAGSVRCAQAAGLLSEARDHVVMLGTLARLKGKAEVKSVESIDTAHFDAATKQVVSEDDGPHPAELIDWVRLAGLLDDEQSAWAQLMDRPIVDDDIRRGLDRTCRKARRGYKRAKKSPDAQTMHGWRKWVKRLRYQLELIGPDSVRVIARLDKLGECLGQFQDLAVLDRRMRQAEGMDKAHRKRMRKTIQARQAKLLKKSLKAGKKLFKGKSVAL
ncbi:MAG: CHAD domain-containing protein [Planctomycetota bacterium]